MHKCRPEKMCRCLFFAVERELFDSRFSHILYWIRLYFNTALIRPAANKKGVDMKRFLAVILLLTITLTGCQNAEMRVETSGTDDFGFSFEVVDGSFKCGEWIEIEVSITNQMEESYKWHGSSTLAVWCRLVCTSGGDEYILDQPDFVFCANERDNELQSGETYSHSYYFDIPNDAPAGRYNLECWLLDSRTTFVNAFSLS